MNDIMWLIRHHIETAPTALFDGDGLPPTKAMSASGRSAKLAAELLAERTEGVTRPRALVAAIQATAMGLAVEAAKLDIATHPKQGAPSRALNAQSTLLADFSMALLAPGAPRRLANNTIRELMESYLASKTVAVEYDPKQIARIKLRLDDPALLAEARENWFDAKTPKTPKTRLKRALVHFLPAAA